MPTGVDDFAQLVSAASYAALAALPKKGKPREDGLEWTLLATFLLCDTPWAQPRVVALGTGTKCLGAPQRCPCGEKLADCHAEVIARRALHAWLFAQIRSAAAGSESVMVRSGQDGRFALAPGSSVHFFVSFPPCGDACVGPSRTGAKLTSESTPGCRGVWCEAGGRPQMPGCVRRKPGRGVPTLSMSCSDKLCRWAVQGLAGGLLASLLAPRPLRCETLTVAGGAAFGDALRRAVGGRAACMENAFPRAWSLHPPAVRVSRPAPPLLAPPPSADERHPCGASLNWWAGSGGAESVEGTTGRLLGATVEARRLPSTRSRICRAAMLARFRAVCAGIDGGCRLQLLSYADAKRAAPEGYRDAKAVLLSVLSPWTKKTVNEDFL